MANFVWLGTVNGDLGNPKNWWNADVDAAATRTPGVSSDNNDNIYFRKSTTANKQLTGKLTSGINDVYFLAGNVTSYTIGSMSATSDGITGQWEILWELQCNDIIVGWHPSSGKSSNNNGFAADRVTFTKTSKTTATSDAYLNSGTYEGTLTGGNLYLGNGANATFVGTTGKFRVSALSDCTVLNPHSTAITIDSLDLMDSGHKVVINNQSTIVRTNLLTCTAKYVDLVGTFPLATNGTMRTNGSEVSPKDAVNGNLKEFAFTSGHTHEVITASPSQGTLTVVNATYVSYPTGTTLNLGGNIKWLPTSVQNSASTNTTPSNYGGFFAGTIVSNNASYAECATNNANAAKYFNVYAKATDALFVGEVGPGVTGNAGNLHITNTTGCTLIGPLVMAVADTSFTGTLTADLRVHDLQGHYIREFTNSSNELILKYTGTTDNLTFATIGGDIDIASTPLTFEIGNTSSGVKALGGTYTVGNLTFKQSGTLTFAPSAAVEIQGNLTISGGTFKCDDTFNFTGSATRTVSCTANTTQQMTLTCASNTTINYDWLSTAESFPALTVNGTLKPTSAITGAANLTGSGTFDWNGGLTATNILFYITASSGTPLSVSNISNANYLTGYSTTFRFECRINGSYNITLPSAISGNVELGASGSPGISSGNDPIFTCPSACVITGNLTIDYSEYHNAATFNAKLMVGTATHEMRVTGDVVIGAKGYCAAQLKITNGNLTNRGIISSNKLTSFSNAAGVYTTNLGTCGLVDLLIDGQGLTSKHVMTGSPTLTGTYTITDAFVTLGNSDITTCVNIAITGASKCTPNQHLFNMSGGGSITDTSTESRTVAGVSAFTGCLSLGAVQLSAGLTGVAGSVILDSIILSGGSLSQNSNNLKKLWIRGGTHPTALANGMPGYKQSNNFTNVAVNGESGSFIFPTSGSNYNAGDTLIIGNANNAEVHIYANSTLTLGVDLDANQNTLTLIKWNSEKGITFGPQSTYTGSFSIKRCDIEGTYDMTEALVSTYKGSIHASTSKLLTIQENNVHSDENEMAFIYIENTEYHKLVMMYNRFTSKCASAAIRTKYAIATAAGSYIAYNHIKSLSTSGTICELNNIYGHRDFVHDNVFSSDTMTSGKAYVFAPGHFDTDLPNTILVNSGVTPIDFSHHTSGARKSLVGWYFDTTNSNFAKSCQGKTNKSMTAKFVNEENDYVLSGIRAQGEATLVQHEDYGKWKKTSGAGVLSSIVLNDKTYRYARSNAITIQSKDIYVNGTTVTASWLDYHAVNKVSVVANYYNGAATTTETITTNVPLTVPSSCIKLYFTITFAQSEGFTDFKVVDNKGRKMFTDAQLTNLGTQTASRTEVGVGDQHTYFGPNITGAVVPHINSQYSDPINQSVWLYLKQNDVGGSDERRWVTLLHEQDSNDFYRFTVHQQATGTNNDVLTIEKSVSGTVTTLVTKTNCNFTAGDSGTDVIFKSTLDTSLNKLIISIEGTTTADWSFTTNATDSTFAAGNWGWAADDGSVLKAQVYDGIEDTQIFVNGLDLIFMPNSSWKFPSTVTNVEMRDVSVNGDQITLLPNLYGTHTTTLNTVSFVSSVLPTSITSLVIIKDSVLTVAGDVTISGNGKLHLIGCKITPTPARWKFVYSGITYTDSAPLLLQGNMLSGMQTTATPEGENMFVVDDLSKNTAVVRIQSTKDMNLTRNAVLGLEFERMIFNGYDSKTLVMTLQSVNDAGIIGKFEEMFMNQTTMELVTPYCHLWKAKVVGFTPRYLNTQATALQAQVTLEEWRDD